MKYARFLLVGLGCVAFALLNVTHNAPSADAARIPVENLTGVHTLAQLPAPAQAVISESIGRDQDAYHAFREAASWRVQNPAHEFGASFDASGAVTRIGETEWRMGLRAWGFGNARQFVAPQTPTVTQNRVAYRRGAVTEWYVNGALGLQQGFTVNAPAHASSDTVLSLALALPRELGVIIRDDGRSIAFQRDGASLAQYAGLTAFDAQKRELRAWLEIAAKDEKDETRALLIRVDTRGAQYPLTIDPLFQKAKLTASDGGLYDKFGMSVAISDDTIAVGAYNDNSGHGAVYVFTRGASGWSDMTHTAKLTTSDTSAFYLGYSVALSGDTIVAGAPLYNLVGATGAGAVYVFVKPTGGWSDKIADATLLAFDGEANDNFGWSVGYDGDEIVVGAPHAGTLPGDNYGAVYLFPEPVGGWSGLQYGAYWFVPDDGQANAIFGWSVAIDGNVVSVGAPGHDSDTGAAYVFAKPIGGWHDMNQTAKLTASDRALSDNLGWSMSISGDTVVAGAPGDNSERGAAYVFVKPAVLWTDATETAKLTASVGSLGDRFGEAVSIVGPFIAVGAPDAAAGVLYAFAEPNGGWVDMTETSRATAVDGAAADAFGTSVALGGGVIVVGAVGDDVGTATDQGSAYVIAPCTAKPARPTLQSPPSGQTVAGLRPTLKWRPATCAGTYSVTVKNAATNQVADSAAGLTDRKYRTDVLAGGTTYRWYVNACNEFGCTRSAARTFQTP